MKIFSVLTRTIFYNSIWCSVFMLCVFVCKSQSATISGRIISEGKPAEAAAVTLARTQYGTSTDSTGYFKLQNLSPSNYTLQVICLGYQSYTKTINLKPQENLILNIQLTSTKNSLNEVVVTGVSKATLIKENPISIVSVQSKSIERTNESNIIDVLVKNVPGLNAVKTGPNISKPFIRGLGYNRVLTLYDGIRQEGQQWGDEHGIEIDAYNIERAEVIKGPASLMYGSDALAGVVSFFPFIPAEADNKWQGKFFSEYQSNNSLIGNGIRLAYHHKKILFALRGSYRLAKNYTNAADGNVYNTNFTEKNFAAFIGYKTNKGYSHFNFTLYDNLQGIPDGSRDSLTRKFTKQIYEGSNDDIKNRPIVNDDELNSYELSPLHQHIQHYRIYSNNNYAIGKGDINFQLAFQQNIRKEYNHPTQPSQAGMYVKLNTVNYGLRYNAPEFLHTEITLGVNGMLQTNKNMNATDFPIPDYNLSDGGSYIHAKWKKEKFTISGGLRYDVRRIQFDDFYVRTNPITGFDEQVNVPDTANASLQFPSFKNNYTGISASIGGTYLLNNRISFKFNIGRGYRAPNITEIASNGLDPGAHIIYLGNRNFIPEFSLQEDIGIITKFKNISAEVSVFNNHIQNYIYLSLLADANGNAITDAQGNKTYSYQQAAAQLYGIEAWFAYHPEKLKDFRFDNSFSIIYGFNKSQQFAGKGLQGEFLPLIPPIKLLSSISQKISFQSKFLEAITPKIEWEYCAAQNRFLELNNSETFTPSYSLLSLGLIADITYCSKQTLLLQIQVNNILDKVYQSNLSRLKYFEYYNQPPTAPQGMNNMGRNICIKLIVPF